MAGAISNLADRLRFGCVVDFLDFRIWPVFNIADSAITVGTLWLLWRILTKGAKDASGSV
jgi:signal peptidase II